MSARARAAALGLVASTAIVGLLALAPSAMASFHLMKIREVDPSTDAGSNDGFVELQMWQPSQNFTNGHQVTVYDGAGAVVDTATLPNVTNGANQARILIGEASTVGGATPDVVDSGLNIPQAAGAVCFAAAPDCVTWGTFTPQVGFPNPQAANAAAPAAGQSLTRSILGGCQTLLEDPQDDTNNSSTDFAATTPTPQANADPIPENDCVLTVNIVGNGVGTVASAPGGISCPADCSQAYFGGQSVLLTATPTASTGSTLDGWGGTCDSEPMPNQCQVNVTTDRTVLVEFDPPVAPQLTVVRAGSGTGTVAGTGIDCGSDCAETFNSNDPVSLTATASSGSTFAGWTGCPSGAGSNPCTYNADIHRTITANFSTIMNPPPVVPATPAAPTAPTTPAAPKKCKKGFVKRKGKCRKKRKK